MVERKFWVTSVILAAFATMVFTGCDSPTGNDNNQPGTDLPGGPGNGGGNQPGDNQPGNGQPRTFTVTFDSDGGSVITAQTGLVSGATATEPTPPTRAWVPPAGLWPSLDWDSLPTTHTFGGWWYEDENWDFDTDEVTDDITLTARWTAPVYTPIEGVEANNVAAAVAHANANTGPFTMAIDQPYVTTGVNTLDAANADLTIVGIGGQRQIRAILADGQRLFYVGPAASGGTPNASLTLGNNITLVGRTDGQHGVVGNSNRDLIWVRNGGRLYMEGTSRITGHTSTAAATNTGLGAAVLVYNYGTFTMSGGDITGNRATVNTNTWFSGGVFVYNANSRFNMEGGSISGNTRGEDTPADVFVNADTVYFTLSGSAAIDHLILNGMGNPAINTFITVGADGWNGNVSMLELRQHADPGESIAWTGRTVLQAATNAAATAAVGNIESARFISAEAVTQDIADTHKIVMENREDDGSVVGKLVAS